MRARTAQAFESEIIDTTLYYVGELGGFDAFRFGQCREQIFRGDNVLLRLQLFFEKAQQDVRIAMKKSFIEKTDFMVSLFAKHRENGVAKGRQQIGVYYGQRK